MRYVKQPIGAEGHGRRKGQSRGDVSKLAVVFITNYFPVSRHRTTGSGAHFKNIETLPLIESESDDGGQLRDDHADAFVAVREDVRGSLQGREQEQIPEMPTVVVDQSGRNTCG